jgi:hypothetical protein
MSVPSDEIIDLIFVKNFSNVVKHKGRHPPEQAWILFSNDFTDVDKGCRNPCRAFCHFHKEKNNAAKETFGVLNQFI